MVIPKNGKAAAVRSPHSFPLSPVTKVPNDMPEATDGSLFAQFGCQPIQVNAKAIGAVRLDQTQGSKRGFFCQLPLGSVVTVIGNGFNEQTVLVRQDDAVYVVFRQDLGLPVGEAALASRVC